MPPISSTSSRIYITPQNQQSIWLRPPTSQKPGWSALPGGQFPMPRPISTMPVPNKPGWSTLPFLRPPTGWQSQGNIGSLLQNAPVTTQVERPQTWLGSVMDYLKIGTKVAKFGDAASNDLVSVSKALQASDPLGTLPGGAARYSEFQTPYASAGSALKTAGQVLNDVTKTYDMVSSNDPLRVGVKMSAGMACKGLGAALAPETLGASAVIGFGMSTACSSAAAAAYDAIPGLPAFGRQVGATRDEIFRTVGDQSSRISQNLIDNNGQFQSNAKIGVDTWKKEGFLYGFARTFANDCKTIWNSIF